MTTRASNPNFSGSRIAGITFLAAIMLLLSQFLVAQQPVETETGPAPVQDSTSTLDTAETADLPAAVETLESSQSAESPEEQRAFPEKTFGDLYHDGLWLTRTGDHANAIAHLQAGLDRFPYHLDSKVGLARAYLEAGQLEAALEAIEQALEQNDQHGDAYHVKARIHHAADEVEDAAGAYETAIALDSANAYALNNLGYIRLEQGQHAAAVEVLEKAVALRSNVAYFYNNLGIAYEGVGSYEQAKRAFQSALDINTEYDKAKVNLERVEGYSTPTAAEQVDTPSNSEE